MAAFLDALGLNTLSGFMQYNADKAQSKAQRAFQAYRNTMTDLSNSVNQNAITQNELASNDFFAKQAVEIKKTYLQSSASTKVTAAAAGVKGRSVNQLMFDVKRNADVAEGVREENLRSSWLAFDQQRLTSSMDAAMQKDYTYIPKPNFMSYMLKAATDTGSQTGWK